MQRTILRFQSLAQQTARVPTSGRIVFKSIFSGGKRSNNIAKKINNNINYASNIGAGSLSVASVNRLMVPAVKYYCTVNNSTDASGDLLQRAYEYQEKGDLNNAYEYARKAADKSTTPGEIVDALTAMSIVALKMHKNGWEDDFISRVKRLDPASDQFRDVFWIFAQLTTRLFKENSVNRLLLFDESLKHFPNHYYIACHYGEALVFSKQLEKASVYFKRATEIDPNKCLAWAWLWFITQADQFLSKAKECPDADKCDVMLVPYGGHLIEQKQTEEGIEYIKKGLQVARSKAVWDEPIVDFVGILMKRQEFSSAKLLLQILIKSSPESVIAWNNLGAIYFAEKDVAKAEFCFKKVVEYNPNLFEGWYNLGSILPPAEAIPMLLKAIEMNPNIPGVHYKLANDYHQLNQNDLALKSIDRAIALNNKDPVYYYLKGIICAKLKRYRGEFLAAYEYYTITSDNPILAYHIFFADQRFEEGLAFAREHIQKDPKQSAFLLQEALYYEAMRRYDDALKAVDSAIQVSQTNGEQGEFIVALKTKGIILARMGNIVEARQMAELLQQQYGFGEYIFALIDRHQGKYDEALVRMKNIMDNSPFDILRFVYFLDFAEALEAKGDLKAAAEQYNLVLEINPAVKRAAERLQVLKQKMSK